MSRRSLWGRARLGRVIAAAAVALLLAAGCVRHPVTGEGVASLTAGPASSMVSLFQTDTGVVAVDLGWWGAESRIEAELRTLGAEPSDVKAVFLSHAHRDHIAGWPLLRQATFYLAEAEEPYFFGEAEYEGWIPRTADRLVDPPSPERGEVVVKTFASDTAFVMGRDTIRAFLVPGHTPGSAAYLIRGIVFAGDALSHTPVFGFRHSLPGYSDDVAEAERSLRSLVERLRPYDARYICTAHAMCAEYDARFLRDAIGEVPEWFTGRPGSPARPDRGPGT